MKVKLNDVIDSLDMVDNQIEYYYNPLTNEFFPSNIGDYENLNNWDNTCYIFKTINRSYFHDDAFKIKVFGDYSIAVPIQNATF